MPTATGRAVRARVIATFASILALNGADTSTVGAIAPQLEGALHVGSTEIGLLISVGLLVGAVFTIPVGLLVDRSRRVPLLAVSIVLWSLASLAAAFAGSYSSLLLSRAALGAVTATAGPAIASLTGDYFPAAERGRIYAYILGGEVAGSAAGYVVSGLVASLVDWRAAFVVLAIPGFFLARTLWRTVPEPVRGGQSDGADDATHREAAREAARRAGAVADPRRVLADARRLSLAAAVRYSLSVPSNLMMVAGTSLGYFYYQGLSAFALLFVEGHYHAGQATAELVLAVLVVGAVIGTLISGRLTDVMLARGMLKARVTVPAACYVLATVLLVPGFTSSRLTPALWFVPAALWGRAEATRTAIRSLAQGIAPTLFGALTSLVAGFVPRQAPIGTHPRTPSAQTATGLEVTFLIMLVALVAGGAFLARARTTYAGDVATAAASEERTRSASRPPP